PPNAYCFFQKGLNLRRRGSDAVRKEKLARPAGAILSVSFAFPADASVLTIFQNYTIFGQFFAYFVTLCEIPPLPRRLTFSDFRFHISVAEPAARRAVAQLPQLPRIVVRNHRKHFIKLRQKRLRRRRIFLPKFSAIHRDICFAQK